MFIIVAITEGNSPTVQTATTRAEADSKFAQIELDKWTQQKTLLKVEDPTNPAKMVREVYFTDGEFTVVEG